MRIDLAGRTHAVKAQVYWWETHNKAADQLLTSIQGSSENCCAAQETLMYQWKELGRLYRRKRTTTCSERSFNHRPNRSRYCFIDTQPWVHYQRNEAMAATQDRVMIDDSVCKQTTKTLLVIPDLRLHLIFINLLCFFFLRATLHLHVLYIHVCVCKCTYHPPQAQLNILLRQRGRD